MRSSCHACWPSRAGEPLSNFLGLLIPGLRYQDFSSRQAEGMWALRDHRWAPHMYAAPCHDHTISLASIRAYAAQGSLPTAQRRVSHMHATR